MHDKYSWRLRKCKRQATKSCSFIINTISLSILLQYEYRYYLFISRLLYLTLIVLFLHPACLFVSFNHEIRKTAHVTGSPEEFS